MLRNRRAPERSTVGPIELFFDLVYVLAIIQLSHLLVGHLDLVGAAQFGVLFAAVWWGWNYSAWAMNWLDPRATSVRLLLMVLMALGFAMALVLPDAFGESGLLFAVLYVAGQVVRPAFIVIGSRGSILARNYRNLLVWSAAAGVLWIAGALLPAPARLAVWALAVVVDYLAPRVDFRVPGLGRAPMSDWDTDAEHLGERNRLVFIIALGESILMMGFTLSDRLTADGIGALTGVAPMAVAGFVGICLMWWSYFSVAGQTDSALVPAPGRHPGDDVGTGALRSAYAYAHALMVAGAIVFAVFAGLLLTHDRVDAAMAVVAASGPILFLAGLALFSRARRGGTLWPQARGAIVAVAVAVASSVAGATPSMMGFAMLVALALPLIRLPQERGTA